VTDTLPGSSGSPVFNLACEAVALHHWGSPHRQTEDADGRPITRFANEGIRISAIMVELRDHLTRLSPAAAALLRAVVDQAESSSRAAAPGMNAQTQVTTTAEPDGSTTMHTIVPITISVKLPGVGGGNQVPAAVAEPAPAAVVVLPGDTAEAEALEIDPDYSNRNGYDPDFLEGFPIPLPTLNAAMKKAAAKSNQPTKGKDASVLDYQHYSVVMHAKRRTAIYAAANIDGESWKTVNRKTGQVVDAEKATKASDKWFVDERIAEDEQCDNEDFQQEFKFQRGHLIRRQYLNWGSNEEAVKGDADSYHYTNCTLQHELFNPKNTQWLGLEDFVLDNATKDKVRVSVFAGPVLRKDDPVYGDMQAPLQFWKIVARLDEDGLQVMAMVASQEDMLVPTGGEAFRPLPKKLRQFWVSVTDVEKLTGLKFGKLRDFDMIGSKE
jgi:endonuclease G, mitochondrial